MKLKRLLGAENGWGGAAGTLLLLGFGLFVLFVSVADLREASRVQPAERGCAEWLADSSGPRWVTLTDCKLNLSGARGEGALRFVPLYVGTPAPVPRAVLATSDAELIAVIDGAAGLGKDEASAFLQSHGATLQPRLTGYVASAKREDAVVLQQGKQPQRLQTVFGMLVGLVAIALVVRSMFMRYLVDRDGTL